MGEFLNLLEKKENASWIPIDSTDCFAEGSKQSTVKLVKVDTHKPTVVGWNYNTKVVDKLKTLFTIK